jgi:hypothetical protein
MIQILDIVLINSLTNLDLLIARKILSLREVAYEVLLGGALCQTST